MDKKEHQLKLEIRRNIQRIFSLRKKKKKFVPGKSLIQYGGGFLDDKEINAAVSVLIDGWFGLGKIGQRFEQNLSRYLGTKGTIITNSGSSASLLAIASLMSSQYTERLNRGDEIITPVCGFPTTVNPLILYGLIPVFLDVNLETFNIEPADLEKAVSKKTRAVFLPHTLGNPNEMDKVTQFCKQHNLLLIEDNCDALGSEYDGKKTGSFGIMSTLSFYPAHHMTTGEGGAVNFNDGRFERIIRSLRDWGRSCWCRGDEKQMLGACKARFNFKIEGKPYDHRYMFSHIGYNLKPIEAQAAIGLEQLKRMNFFVKKREQNFQRLMKYAKEWTDYFILPRSLPKAKPCWFAFPLTIKSKAKFSRYQITTFLENRRIQTRPVFAGNIIRQPAYWHINHRKVGALANADHIIHNTFFVGIYPGLGNEEIDFIAQSISDFLRLHL